MPFAGYPAPFMTDPPGKKKVQQLLWGDFVQLLNEEDGDFVKVHCRGTDAWIRKTELQDERLLELNFVDIGQGDGCFIVMPSGKFLMIDAGESDNMFRYLRWRFNLRADPDRVITIPDAVISHPDQDHYRGYASLFADPQFRFTTIHHNGIIERTGADPLGPKVKVGRRSFLTDVIRDLPSLRVILDNPVAVGAKVYPTMLKFGLDSGRIQNIQMLCSEDGFLPGYSDPQGVLLRVLGPVPDPDENGLRRLRWFTDPGKTKNGHSVVLRLEYKQVKILLGGDLNVPAEEHLLEHHTGLDPRPETPAAVEALVTEARKTFESDVAKACHHGSADFTGIFLLGVNALATVVSSGDREPHCHPRPDALGALGRCGRGDRPLIFSTELARSTRENIRDPQALREQIRGLSVQFDQADTDGEREVIAAALNTLFVRLERSVAVYGLINVRTDGERVVLAQKLETPRGTGEKWDVHCLEPGADGRLAYVIDD